MLYVVPVANAANQEVQIGIPYVPQDVLQQDARLLFGGRVNDQNIFIISKKDRYTRGIQTGKFDAFFAKANIGAWAVANHSYEAIAKLRDPLFIRLIARNDQIDIFEFKDLDYRTICTEESPDITFHFLQTLFEKPESLSEKMIISPQKKIEKILGRNCIGAVVNESRLKLSPEKKHYVTLARSKQFSQIGFFVRKDINREVREHLVNRLFSTQSKSFINDLKRYFSTPKDELVPASNSDYPKQWAQYTPKTWNLPLLKPAAKALAR